jgi:hypothetical protein
MNYAHGLCIYCYQKMRRQKKKLSKQQHQEDLQI